MRTFTPCSQMVYEWRTRYLGEIKTLLSLFILFFFFHQPIHAQLVGGPTVKANLGVDGDVYANTQLLGTTVPNTDDWFLNTTVYPGTGKNIIDQTQSAELRAAVLANLNDAFSLRMSVPQLTVVDGRLWVDAVYGRDNNSIGSSVDASIFSGSSNKNGDNPTTWSLGTGSVPQKNDLIDVFGHLRFDGPDPLTSHLWGYAGSTTRSADGESHVDYEIYRTISYTSGASSFTGTGPNEGHTAFSFGPTGLVSNPGDLIVSVDFATGGTSPSANVRIWIAKTIWDNRNAPGGFNSLPDSKFTLSDEFDQGNGAVNYGYALIAPKPNVPQFIWAAVNTTADVLGAPWGSIEGNSFQDNILQLQYSEFAIDATAIGLILPQGAPGEPCKSILGNLLVKTRSSTSFTAELKDFAGPYEFANTTLVRVNAGADQVLTCTNPTANLIATNIVPPNSSVLWTGPGGFSQTVTSSGSTANPITVSVAGTYTATVSAGPQGCFAADEVVVTENKTPPNVNAGADKVLTCTTTSVTLDGSSTTAGATFAWAGPGGFTSTSATPSVTAAGTYTLTVTNPANGCTATDVALVTLDANAPNANAGADKVLTCTTTSVTLNGSSTTAGATFAWAGPGGFTSTSATPSVTVAGTYTLTVTNPANGCTATDVALVTLNNTPPNVNAGADKVLTCTTTSVTLDGSSTTAGATFAWAGPGGFTSTSATPSVTVAGTYTLTVTNPANGCTATDLALVTLNNTPPNANAGPDKVITCTTTSVTLNGSSTTAGATFAWAGPGGFTSTSATPTVTVAGTYTLTVTNPANGCTATDVALVTLDANAPNANAGADKVITCTTTSVTLNGSSTTAGVTFAWAGPGGFTSTSATPTVTVAGTYTLTVTAPNGCTATDVALVTLNNTPPNVNAGADKVITCTTTSVTLDGSSTTAGATFAWAGPGGFTSTSATPTVTAAGTYTLTVTNPANGCTATDVALVTLNNTPPNANAGADKVITCTTTSVTLNGSSTTAGATFAWAGPGGFTSTSATPTVTVAGTYTLTVTNPANGCTATDVAVVTVNANAPNANAGPDKVITCTTTSVTLNGSSTTAGATFAWAGPGGFTSTSATPTVTVAGTYTLTVTNPANGCTATDVALVTVDNTPPNVNAGPDLQIACQSGSGMLNGSSTTPGATFAWTGPGGFTSTSATPTVTLAGTYTLTVTGPNGCTASDAAVVTKQPCVVFCSFTQGFWGNKNGLAMLPGLLTTPITIGRPGHSVIIPVGSAVTLNNVMPGGQSPKLLLAGDCSITQSCFSAYLTKQGRINNVLLSQTITLSLNVRLNGGILNSLPIQSGWLTTQNQSGDCISTSSVQMNQNVVNYLTYNGATATVADLLNLANDVLGGTLVPGTNVGTVANPRIVPSLDDINSAVDAINNAFDGCRTFVGYFACQKNCSNLNLPCNAVVSANTIRISEAGIAEQVKVKAFPNPFNDRIRFTIKSTRSGQGSLEVFNTLGQKVNTVFQGYIHAGSEQVVEYKVPSSNRQNMIYVMTLNGERVAGKLLNAKE